MFSCSGQTKTNINQLNKDDCKNKKKKLVHLYFDFIEMHLIFKNNSPEAKSCTEIIKL